jgi:hypothetical protein
MDVFFRAINLLRSLPSSQGDQIRRTLDHWLTVYFWAGFYMAEVANIFGYFFPTICKSYALIWTKK